MARLRAPFPASLVQEVRRLLKGDLQSNERARLRTVALADDGLSNVEIAKELRLSVTSVRIYQSRARHGKATSLLNRKKGGRFREYLSKTTEAEVLERELPKAMSGGIVVVTDIKRALENAAGRSYHLNSVYRLLARHNWRKIAPRRVHPQQMPTAVEDFKKNGQGSSLKQDQRPKHRTNRSVSSSRTKRDSAASATRAAAGRPKALGHT